MQGILDRSRCGQTALRATSVGRYYDPNTAQFISVDPYVVESHAPYAFGGDNPLGNTDPTGLLGGGLFTGCDPFCPTETPIPGSGDVPVAKPVTIPQPQTTTTERIMPNYPPQTVTFDPLYQWSDCLGPVTHYGTAFDPAFAAFTCLDFPPTAPSVAQARQIDSRYPAAAPPWVIQHNYTRVAPSTDGGIHLDWLSCSSEVGLSVTTHLVEGAVSGYDLFAMGVDCAIASAGTGGFFNEDIGPPY